MGETIQTDVLVVGGGIIGFTCAYYLNQAGFGVHLIEREQAASGASYGNCGLMLFSDLVPLCQPGVVGKQLRQLLRQSSPLYIKFDLDISRFLWLLRFAGKCTRKQMRQALEAREKILYLSKQLFTDLMERERLACDWQRRGVLMVYKDQAAMDAYEATNALLRPYGLAAKPVSKAALRQLEPALATDVCGAWHHDTDSYLRPENLVRSLRDLVVRKGVVVHENCPLEGFETRNGRVQAGVARNRTIAAGHYVLAAGAWSPLILRDLNLRLPVQPAKGYSITLKRPEVCPRLACYFYGPRVVATPWEGGLRLGGTLEFSGFNSRLETARLDNLRQAAASYLRSFKDDGQAEQWVGMRPMTWDDLPIIGPVPSYPNLLLATGHGMMGMTMATGTGRIITDLIEGKHPGFDISAFRATRF